MKAWSAVTVGGSTCAAAGVAIPKSGRQVREAAARASLVRDFLLAIEISLVTPLTS
jgi:hypothetical protein